MEGLYMFCKNCGKELLEGASFCSSCGTAVTVPGTENPQSENASDKGEEKVVFGAPVGDGEATSPIYQMPQYNAPVEEKADDKKNFSLASLILGICSLLPCCCVNFITAILAVIFGIIGIKSSNKTLSIVGIILAAAAFLIYLIAIIVYIALIGASSGAVFDEFMYY